MYPELLSRRCSETTARLRVTRLRVADVRRSTTSQQRSRPNHTLRPPLADDLHDLLTALCRGDAGPRRNNVRQRLVPGVSDARKHRLGRGGDRTHDRFVLEGRQVCPRSPTTHDGNDVAVAPAEGGDGPRQRGRRAGALHSDPHMGDTEPEPRARELPEEVRASLGARAGNQADVERDLGQGKTRIALEQSFGVERLEQLGSFRRQLPEQSGDVDLGQDEAEFALGPVEIERAPQDHHHALGQLDALLGQTVAQRCPRAAPALHAERGHATAGAVTPSATLVLGVDQAQVEVTRAMVRDVLNFATDPEMAVPRKGQVERTFDLLVDATDGVDPSSGPFVLSAASSPPGPVWRSDAATSGGASGSKS